MKSILPGLVAAGLLFAATAVRAQEQDTLVTSGDTLDVIVYSGKFAEQSRRIAQTIKVIRDRATLNFQPNTGDVLMNTGSLFVQKSQQGGGSPVIRGFEASRIVLMVDGVRMNNAIYRAGHLQNIITVDNTVLNRIEVIYGPSSTLYGSDALGGVVNLFTKDPVLSAGKTSVGGGALLRYALANEEAKAHVDFNIGGRRWASFTSVTWADFGDVKQGASRRPAYPGFGLKPFIVTRIGNTDTAMANPDPRVQSPAGYSQWDLLQKILYQPAPHRKHLLNLQLSGSTDVPRYDRLTETSGGNPVFAEWYYGPQVRNMASYQFEADQLGGFFREIKLVASFQDIAESRINRRFRNNNKNYNWEKLSVFGFNIDAKRHAGKHEIHLGAESYTNLVRSRAERRNIVTGAVSKLQTRYSDGPTNMFTHAVYLQHTLKFNESWTLNEGLRVNHVALNATFLDTATLHLPFTQARQRNLALTGNLGLVYAGAGGVKAALLFSSGFRSPNVDDLTKVFDTRAGAVIVPNPDVRPEYTYNTEISLNKHDRHFSLGGSLFYTWFRNVLVVDRDRFNESDSLDYQGVRSAVFSMQNKASAFVCGFSVNASATLFKGTVAEGVFTYTYGRYKNNNSTLPLDHIPPAYGRLALKHSHSRWIAEAYALFNGWKRIADYSPSGEDNQQYATPDGMPSWISLNAKATVQAGKNLQAQLMVENILDRNYRYFASGISAPGRNISLSMKLGF